MSKNLSKNKKIKTTFTAKQPGYINVAGETFFLSDDDESGFSATLVNDSVKGDIAFQELFLKPFSAGEKETLRRIYRTIFGSGSIVGKKGLQLPCEDEEVDLLVKSLIYRRDKLIEQIKSYQILLSNDVHARYMRDHLVKLNKLIDDEIPNTLAPCKDTDIDVDGTGRLSGLNNTRMLKLLEIFAFLLAQGKDPLAALKDANPSPQSILYPMARREAKRLRDYEAEFEKLHPGQMPQYTETLKKLRRILTDKTPEPISDKELQSILEEIEKYLGITDKSGSPADRKARILEKLKELPKCLADLADSKRSLAETVAERDRLKGLLDDCEKKAKDPLAEIAKLKDEIDGLKKELEAAQAELKKLTAELHLREGDIRKREAEIEALKKKIEDLDKALLELEALRKEVEELRPLKGKADITVEALQKLKDRLAELEKRPTAEQLAELQAEVDKLRPFQGRADITPEDLAAKEAELVELRKRADITPADLAAKEAELIELRKRPNITQEALDSLNAELERLRLRPDITADELAELRAEVERLRPFDGRPDISNEDLQTLRERSDRLDDFEWRAEIDEDDLDDLNEQLERLKQRADITPQRLQGLNAELDSLLKQVEELKKRPNITSEELQKLRSDLETANRRVYDLEEQLKQMPELQQELRRIREELGAAKATIAQLQGRADITPEELATIKTNLTTSQQEVANLTARVRELERRPTIEAYEALQKENEDLKEENKGLKEKVEAQSEELEKSAQTIKTLLNYKEIFEDLNKLLIKKGFEPLPEPNDGNLGEISERLDSYLQKPGPIAMTETTNLCTLYLVFTLMKNVYITRGTSISTDKGKYAALFQKIDTHVNEPIDNDIADLFFWALNAWKTKGAPDVSRKIVIVNADKIDEYKRKFEKIKRFTALFDSTDRDAGSYILREMIPKNNNFTRYILTPDNNLIISTKYNTQSTTTDMGLLFVLFLTYVNKVLVEKRPELEAAGCPILA